MRALKDSGIDWIGEIPCNWSIERNKNCFTCAKTIVGTSWYKTQLLSLTTKGIKEKAYDDITGKIPADFGTYQLVEPNDNIMCLFDLDVSAVFSGISPSYGMISPAYKVLKTKNIMNSKYADYWFSFVFVERKFKPYSKNIRYTLSYDEFAALPIILPPLEEQILIANFLDKKSASIDKIISKTKEAIEEYKKLKQAIITQAVTKGLNSDVEMKGTGVECIGMIPSHWNIKRFKYIADSLFKGNGISKDEVKEDGNVQCVRYGEIYSKYDEDFERCFSKTFADVGKGQVHISKGNILFSGTGELVEEIGKNVVYMGDEDCLAGGDIIVCTHSQDPLFLNYSLNSEYSQKQKSMGKTKLKVVHISASEIGDILVPLPPISEQKEIGQFIKKQSIVFSNIINSMEKEILELEQYKKSLIYEYVTGKKEVLTYED